MAALRAQTLLFFALTCFLPLAASAQTGFDYLPLGAAPAVPEAVDIIVEGEGYTPAFYAGRSEPTSGTRFRATAIAHNAASSSALRYEWYLDGARVGTEQSVTLTTPTRDSYTLKVNVFNDASLVARREERVVVSPARVALYENNALRGLSRNAITNGVVLIGDEISITAVPYFVDKSTIGRDLRTAWEVLGQEVQVNSPLDLTIRRENYPYTGTINFIMNNYRSLEQTVANFTLYL